MLNKDFTQSVFILIISTVIVASVRQVSTLQVIVNNRAGSDKGNGTP